MSKPSPLKSLIKSSFATPDRPPGDLPDPVLQLLSSEPSPATETPAPEPASSEPIAAVPAAAPASEPEAPEPQQVGPHRLLDQVVDSLLRQPENVPDQARGEVHRPTFRLLPEAGGTPDEPARQPAPQAHPAPPTVERSKRVGRKPNEQPLTQFTANIEERQARHLVFLASRESMRIGRKVEMSEIVRYILNDFFTRNDERVLRHEADAPLTAYKPYA